MGGRRTAFGFAAAVAFAVLSWSVAHAVAQVSDGKGDRVARRVPLSDLPPAQVNGLVVQAVSSGRVEDARKIARDYRPADPDHPQRVRFVEGLVLQKEGRHAEAATVYRKILAERPDIVGVRLQLSKALFLANDDDAAKYQLETLVASGLDERLGGELGSLIDRIDARRPFRFKTFLSVLPSTNLNSGTDHDKVVLGGVPLTIDADARRRSGVGFLLGGEASWRHDLDERWSVITSASLVDRFYPTLDKHLASVGGSAGLAADFGRTKGAFSLLLGRDVSMDGLHLDDLAKSYDYVGAAVEGSRTLPRNFRLSGGVVAKRQEFVHNDRRDGWNADVTVYLDKFLSPSRFVRAIAGGEFERTNLDRLDFDEVSAGLGAFNEFAGGFSLYGEATIARRVYGDDFPGLDEAREDTRLRLRAVATKRDLSFWGVAPQLSYTFTHNASNSVFDDHDRHDVDLRLTSEF